jgi:two-component system, chemotaxis family, protein-glutamate methylesterase/glutaminase
VIRVLVVDDSPVARQYLVQLLESEPGLQVIGTAANGEEAVAAAAARKPDVITMDIFMPGLDGLQATRRIMESHPVPIVIVSANWPPGEAENTFRAMEAGALALVRRPAGPGHPEHGETVRELLDTVKLMSEVKLVRRWPRREQTSARSALPRLRQVEVVAVGASVGGPPVLQTILSRLPASFPVPILIVQHMAPGFLQGMVNWLAQTSGPVLLLARHGDHPLPGCAYFAPDGFNMGIAGNRTIHLSGSGGQNRFQPTVAHLFRSVATVYGRNAAGVLLTGMGRDGAAELKIMREKGAVTIIQDQASSVVFGMPGAAFELEAADCVLSPEKIARALQTLPLPGPGTEKEPSDAE